MLDISNQLQDIMCSQQVDSGSALLILLGGKTDESVHESVSNTTTKTVREHNQLGARR